MEDEHGGDNDDDEVLVHGGVNDDDEVSYFGGKEDWIWRWWLSFMIVSMMLNFANKR